MTWEKDIEILQLNLKEAGSKMPPDVKDALKHSIEALFYVSRIREYPHLLDLLPLPSETD